VSFKPRLRDKAKLRWDRHAKTWMLLFPERGLVLNEVAYAIAHRSDGTRTVAAIVAEIAELFEDAPADVETLVAAFLEALASRGLLYDASENAAAHPEAPANGQPAAVSALESVADTLPARPFTLIAELSYKCPLKCLYCSNPENLRDYNDELDTANWLRILREAESFSTMQVHLTGGEPLVRRDLEELVAGASTLGLYVNLITSGLPQGLARLDGLIAAGLSAIQVSMQDVTAEGALYVSDVDAVAAKVALMRTAKARGLPVTMNVVLHRQNLDRIEAFIALAEAIGVDRLELANTQYLGWALKNRDILLPTDAQLAHARAVAGAAKNRLRGVTDVLFVKPDYFGDYPRACMDGWARRFLHVAPNGTALPCHAAMQIAGIEFPNLRTSSVADAWHSDAFNTYRGDRWMNATCASCERKTLDYGGCRCQAFALTGVAGATDPVCTKADAHHLIAAAKLRRPAEVSLVVGGAVGEPARPGVRHLRTFKSH
jgi:PqqA peptide cyclase